MKESTKDRIEGAVKEAKGNFKERAGNLVGNTRLQDEGRSQKLSGKIQTKVGQIKKVFDA